MSARGLAVQLERRGIRDPRVLEAFAAVRRELFVPGQEANAYDDNPLSIGHGQTISQPYVVAITIEALALRGDERVLEIGAGSGYAAAVLALLAFSVDTVERVPALCELAAERLARLAPNVRVHCADGTLGCPAHAPYEAIAVAAGAPTPPPALLSQLAIGGRLVIPTGEAEHQRLVKITRVEAERYEQQDLGDVRFVPLIGRQGWADASMIRPS